MPRKSLKAKPKSQALVKRMTIEETETLLKTLGGTNVGPEPLVKETTEALNEFYNAKGKNKESKKLALNKKLLKALSLYALDNHFLIAGTVTERISPMVTRMASKIIQEYACKTESEKALAEMIAGSYGRYIQYSEAYRVVLDIEFLSHEKTRHYEAIAREADRAHRQFIAALVTLKQIKTPAPIVNVKAGTAFVARNQQLNVVKGRPE